MKKAFWLFVLAWISFPCTTRGDDRDVSELPTRERIFIGGNIGFQADNISIMFNISPVIGYRVTNRVTAGLGLTYQYYRDSSRFGGQDYSATTHIYGGNVFARYLVTRYIFAQTEFEALNLDNRRFGSESTDENRFWEYNYFVGGGYRAYLGPRTYLNLTVLYNLNSNSVVYFQNPIFRVGVDVRL